MDILSPKERSHRMSLIRAKDTKVELVVRRLVSRLGYRYRLYYAKLPGKPDLVFVRRRKVIFVHGCFWHGHKGCPKARLPKSRRNYWVPKIARNLRHGKENVAALQRQGWSALIVWECELRKPGLDARIKKFLD